MQQCQGLPDSDAGMSFALTMLFQDLSLTSRVYLPIPGVFLGSHALLHSIFLQEF